MTSLYIKIGLILLTVAAIFGFGYHVGSLQGKAAVARLQRDNAQAIVTAQAQAQARQSSIEAQLTALETRYEAIRDIPDPVIPSAHRLFIAACSDPVPAPSAHPGNPPAASPQPRGPTVLESALDHALEACAADARQLNALIEAVAIDR